MTVPDGPLTPLARLWRRLALPVNPVEAADTLTGIPPANARRLFAVALATSPEADELVTGIPVLLRSLAVSTATRPVRCEGEIRGPVLWSETMAARSASPGAGGVFVCSSPSKAYDTDENRVLVAAFSRLYRAAMAADSETDSPDFAPHPDDVKLARHHGDLVRRALEHRSLQAVTRVRPNGRMMQKARTGTKAGVFRTAVDLLQRSWADMGAHDLDEFITRQTLALLELVADVVDILSFNGVLPDRLKIVDGSLTSGPFAYRHPTSTAVVDRGLPP
ncbi:MAG TPA: hypothetical protein VFK43_22965, partial [Acidimicrobiales bacterium]|nr:hypothetical protein [Acidimicrobiales bacterium]